MEEDKVKKAVRKEYAKIAVKGESCCGPVEQTSPCCAPSDSSGDVSKKIGYTDEQLKSIPEGANFGLGCGNPTALASLKDGETVLDLGAGPGMDCFLAANKVGKKGKVIGVDMTPEMIDKARENARKGNYENVEFRLGEIENLPAADNSVDVIISNCVINLSSDKRKVYQEAFRILKPGGRIMISDIVLTKELPEQILNSIEAYVGCISGAMLKSEYMNVIKEAGFGEIDILEEKTFPLELVTSDPAAQTIISQLKISKKELANLGKTILSITVQGKKP